MRKSWLYRILRPIIWFIMRIIFRAKVIGAENIPKSGRIVLAGNHTNLLDSLFIVSTTKRTVHFLAKKELLSGKASFVFKNMGIIPVDRKIHDKGALNAAIEALNNDEIIGIFPESTINRTDDIIMPFKIGAVKMAHETNSNIVPFIITGKYKIFGSVRPKIEFLKPISVKDKDLTKNNEKLMKIVSDKLQKERP